MPADTVLDALRASLKEAERLRKANRQLMSAAWAPVAIVAIGCRFPGGVRDPEGLWELLAAGRDAITEFPADRGWDLERIFDSDPDRPGTSYVHAGGFVRDATEFDPGFFAISPREALAMDPQQRLLLETSWEAFERAGIDPSSLRGSQTGVFVGAAAAGYGTGLHGLDGHLLTGTAASVMSGRVSYLLGLEGPAVTVDTACSSSLVALHLACQALRAGECSLALAGGAAIMATPQGFIGFSRQRGLAADGRCKAFSAAADGMGMAEGVGMLVVERLSDAHRNGHPVLAVIRGSAVNQDGASNGLTAPNGPSQQRVIKAALACAQLSADQVDVVEAHGTGTALGDPIEAQALIATYGQDRDPGCPVLIGSVKSNIGHAQAAAGVAGVIKAVLALRHGVVPATLHVTEPSPHVDWSAGTVRLVTEPTPWPAGERERRAAVSSFGISGTNAHVIIEEAPASETAGNASDTPAVLERAGIAAWLVSARSAEGLAAQSRRLAGRVAGLDPVDVGWSLATTRTAFEHRAVVVGGGVEGLAAVASGESAAGVVTGSVPAGGLGQVVFVFPGQGGQWAGMGRELAAASPVFAARLAECGAALTRYVDWSLEEALAGAHGLDRADVVQPALWAVMVSLAAVWQAAGVMPDAVLGHSQGEIAAATVAGVLSLEDAARVVALRSRALRALAGRGGMASVAEPAARVRERIRPWGDRLAVAAVNGPAATVVSGELDALAALVAGCERDGMRARVLPVDYASHCAQVEGLRGEIMAALDGLRAGPARVPMISAATGQWMAGPELDAGYWYESLRSPVEFEGAVRALAGAGHGVFIEVSPHPVLTSPVTETVEEGGMAAPVVTGTLRRDDGGPARLLASLAEAYARGVPVRWTAVLPSGHRVDLPTYAFQRQRYWPGPAASAGDLRSAGLGVVGSPLLSASVELAAGDGLVLTGRLSMAAQPWLADHAVRGTVLLPGAAFVELVITAGDVVACDRIEELALEAPLVVPATGGVQLQVVLGGPGEAGRRAVEVYARPEGTDGAGRWNRHASGWLGPAVDAGAALSAEFAVWPPEGAVPVQVAGLYDGLAAAGYGYGPVFRGLRRAWRRGEDVFAEAALPEDAAIAASGFALHPALLDAALQVAGLAAAGGSSAAEVRLPFAWTGAQVYCAGASALRVRLRLDAKGDVSLAAADSTGAPVVSVDSLVSRPLAATVPSGDGDALRDALFEVRWRPVPAADGKTEPGPWAIAGSDPFGLAETITQAGGYPDLQALADAITVGEPLPEAVLVCGGTAATQDPPASARAEAGRLLRIVQDWLNAGWRGTARLIVVTRGAMAARSEHDVTDLTGAAIWGLIRSAQSEHPGQVVLADLPTDSKADAAALARGLATGEPEFAIRDGVAYVRRLTRPEAIDKLALTMPPAPAATGTALITGGTGTLGSLVAQHLVSSGRAGQLVLASRSGPAAPGSAALAAELAAGGAGVQMVACDAANRDQLASVLADLPLTIVVHAAGTLDDATIGSLSGERIDAVMRTKADAAWNLHSLTRGIDLTAFVLFSSAASVFGGPGQGNYSAGNAFLDALAAYRRSAGLVAVSLAWGLWDQASGMTGHLRQGDISRMARGGVIPISAADGLALFDQAIGRTEPLLVPVRLDIAALRAQAAQGAPLPALLRELIGAIRPPAAPVPATAVTQSLRGQLAAMPALSRDRMLLDIVRGHVAAVLGHASPEAIDPGRPFKDLGFDSLTALELRNRLNASTGLRLPATLIFDYPTLAGLADYLRAELLGGREDDQAVTAVPAPVTTEPIAIVGMGCRYPGGVSDPEGLWDLVADGADAISGLPADRGWDAERVYDPDPDHEGTSYVLAGGFVHDATEFDAGFFGISPREALAIDPQQRLLLETSWEAFERAGIDPLSLRGSQTGVFVGAAASGYGGGLGGLEGHLVTGIAGSVMSGRVSYTLGLEGPAVTVDTACSSSLVALHLAKQALSAGECTLALAGGVTIIASLAGFIGFSRQRALAADGRCKAFSAAADGMGMAEGVGLVVLERLSDARRNGHPVLAVLTGSAVNQDGASNGLTAPNGPSQQRVIRAALARAGVSADEVDAVEAHGTGTALGDPIEAQALIATYGQRRPADRPVWLGSVKSNIGHTVAAAGVAGVIKMVQALKHGVLPATLHAQEPSSHVDWSAGEIRLLTSPVPWPANGRVRRAAVSSFGISGTNAHAIIEEPPAAGSAGADSGGEKERPLTVAPLAWLVSGRSAAGLRAQATRLGAWLAARPDLDPVDVGWSLATSRSAFERRAVVLGDDRDELVAGLAAVAASRSAAGVSTGVVRAGGGARVGFVFAGQGSQRAGMGAGLHAASPVFAAAFDEACGLLEAELGVPVADVVLGRAGEALAGRADETVFAQAGLFAVQVGLVAVLSACGITPDAVAGHSVGEVAAAHAAGILSLEDACRLVAARARLMQGLPPVGAMAAIAMPEAEVAAALAGVAGVSIAAVNGPSAAVVTGDADAVARVAESFAAGGTRVRSLRVSHAFHSAHMDPVLAELGVVAAGLEHRAPRVPWAGALTGELVSVPGPGYWVRQAREAVRYADAVAALAAQGVTVFLEIGPDGTLSALGPAVAAGAVFIPAQRPGQPGAKALAGALAQAHVHGVNVDWAAVLPAGRRVDLPTYAFQRDRYWPQTSALPVGAAASSTQEQRFWAAVDGADLSALTGVVGVEEALRPDMPLADALALLSLWRRREQENSATESCRYRMTWQPVGDPAAALTGNWLVVAPPAEQLTERLADALRLNGAIVTVVHAAGVRREELTAILSDTGLSVAAGVVSLLALQDQDLPGCPGFSVGAAATLALLQALGDVAVSAPCWVLTRGAVSIADGDPITSPAQAGAWGLGPSAALECPARWGGLVDLPPKLDVRAGDRLCGILSASTREDQAAIRAAGIFVRRLRRAVQPRRPAQAWKPVGAVLVTGEISGPGAHIATWLARNGAAHVVLASREGVQGTGTGALAAQLAELGARVTIRACDLADKTAAATLLDETSGAGSPLTAIVHAPGSGQAAALADIGLAEVARAVQDTVSGALHLDELTKGMELAVFAVFSSAAGVWGSKGRTAYSVANGYLDALAFERRARGQAAVSISWGPWDGAADGAELKRPGVQPMTPDLAIAALRHAVEHDETQLTVAAIDWQRFVPVFTSERPSPLLSDLCEVGSRRAADTADGDVADWTARVSGLSSGRRAELMLDLVRGETTAVLGHPADIVDADSDVLDLGMSSIYAVELGQRLLAQTGVGLAAGTIFDLGTPAAIAEFLLAELSDEE
jgi:acyl transferase domain-containing protein/acyl carrier protein